MRAFECDGFISHNAFDEAQGLATELERHGARVFCDEATDLSDLRVKGRIDAALMKSQCVVVHVPPGFRDSEWCRAEYQPSLYQGLSKGFTRVVVARGAPNAPVPTSLAVAPIFDVPSAVSGLAGFLIASNRVPEDIVAELKAQKANADRAPLGRHHNVSNKSMSMLIEVVSMLWDYVERNDRSLSAGDLAKMASVGRKHIDAADNGTRTDGHRALILVAALANKNQALALIEEIKSYLCREANAGVLRDALWLYFWARLPAVPQDTWLAAALLRATVGVKTVSLPHEFLTTLPEPVRCRVVQGKIGLGVLSPTENALLLDRRLERLLERDALLVLEPYEIEGSLRELLPYLYTNDETTGTHIKELYRRLVERVLAWAEWRGGEPIRQMGEYACDVLVAPMAELMTEKETSLQVFERACQLVEEHTNARDLVNRLRVMGHLVRAGVPWLEAWAQTDEAWSGVAHRHQLLRTGRLDTTR